MPGKLYKFEDDAGQIIEFNWDLPGEPTDEDIDRIVQERQQVNTKPVQFNDLPTFQAMQLPKAITPRWPVGGITDTPRGILGGMPQEDEPMLGGRASRPLPQFDIPELQLPQSQQLPRRPIGIPHEEIGERQPIFAPPRMSLPDFREGANPAATRFFPEQEEAVFNAIGKTPIIGDYAEPTARFLTEGITSPMGIASELAGGGLGAMAVGGGKKLLTRGAKKAATELAEDATVRGIGGMAGEAIPAPSALGDLAAPPMATTMKPRYRLNAEGVMEPYIDQQVLASGGPLQGGIAGFPKTATAMLPAPTNALPDMIPTLPRDLKGARPRYGMGAKSYEPIFESDLDKALYTVAQGNKNKRHNDYMKFITDHTGMSEDEAIAAGKEIRTTLKGILQGQPEGQVNVPSIFKQPVASTASKTAAKTTVKETLTDAEIANMDDDELTAYANALEKVKADNGILPTNKPKTKSKTKVQSSAAETPKVSDKVTKTASGTAQVRKNGPEVNKDNVERAKQIILNKEETAGAVKILNMTDDELIRHAETLEPDAFVNPAGVVKVSNPAVAGHPIMAAAAPPSNVPPPKFNPPTPEAALEQLEAADKLLMASTKTKPISTTRWLINEAINLPRSLWATGDYGAALRNGKGLIGTKEYWNATKNMFIGGWSEEGAKEVTKNLENLPFYNVFTSKQKFNPGIVHMSEATHLLPAEEQFAGTLAKHIPSFKSMVLGLAKRDARYTNLYRKDAIGKPSAISKLARGSERAHMSFLNTLRGETMSNLLTKYEGGGLDPFNNPELVKATADFISSLTGRGNMGTLEHSMQQINQWGFAAKFAKSRLDQSVNFVPRLLKAPRPVQKEMLKAHTRILGWWSGVAGLAYAAGGDVEWDPTSSDFGKIQIGNIRWDPLSGIQQPFVATVKILSGLTTSATSGKTTGLGTSGFFLDREAEYGGRTGVDVATDYLRGRAAPGPGVLYDYFLKGTDFKGDPIVGEMSKPGPDNYFAQMATPNLITVFRELYNEDPEGMSQLGIPLDYMFNGAPDIPVNIGKLGLAGLATFGEGVQTFDKQPRATGQYAPRRSSRQSQYRSQYAR